MLRRVPFAELSTGARFDPVDRETLAGAGAIVDDVRERGEPALREHSVRLGDLPSLHSPLVLGPEELEAAARALEPASRAVLERTAARIAFFARAQRRGLQDLDVAVPAGRAGITYRPVDRAGCYAPGGRFPLPSSVLMTAVTARAAGVREVWVASPRPSLETRAAAHIAGADGLLVVGGAQAIAALAWGAGPVPACDAIVGPGNRWVTAAKKLVAGHVAIDMLAGPSELVVLADAQAHPDAVAADLLAQAEHDPDALPVLVATDAALLDAVDQALARQLATLPTAPIARRALENGFAVLATSLDEGLAACDGLAAEHLALHLDERDLPAAKAGLRHYGALFVGGRAAEVFGDYGVGPNHVLPTGGSARSTGALSVLSFLRAQTWLALDAGEELEALVHDAAALARMEGLEAHARAAEQRGGPHSSEG